MENLNTIRSTQNFKKNYRVIHQKGRKVPNHLQTKVKIELEKFLNEGDIEKLSNCSGQFFTILHFDCHDSQKRPFNQIKIGFKTSKKAIDTNKYHMPILDSLIQTNS